MKTVYCATCGTAILNAKGRRRFCSERCRKAQYAGTCTDCGNPTSGSEGRRAEPRCPSCAMRRALRPDPVDADPGIPGLIPIRDRTGMIIDFARVDISDWEDGLRHLRLHLRAKGYVATMVEGHRPMYLHHLIVGHLKGETRRDRQCDHFNRDPTDNRRSNLRVVTAKENCANRGGIYEEASQRKAA